MSSTPAYPRVLTISVAVLATTWVGGAFASSAPEGVATERVRGADRSLVRSLTVAPGAVVHEVPADGTVVSRGIGLTDLWIDTSHADAIAERVAITGDGGSAIVGWWLNNERTSLYAVTDDAIPEWTHAMPASEFQIEVGADETGSILTAVSRSENFHVFEEGSSVPIDEVVITPPQTGRFTDISANGERRGVTTYDDGTDARVEVFALDGTSIFQGTLNAAPQGMDISADGSVVAVNARAFVKVWEVSGALRDSVQIPGETQATAVVSGDGTYLATGGFQRTLRLFEWSGSSYDLLWQSTIPATTWITSIAISDDGTHVAAGTWTNPTGGKVVVWSTSSSTAILEDATYGDYVSSVDFTPDAARLIAGSWGRDGATVGAIVSVYHFPGGDQASIQDDFMPGVGSVQSVSISDDGTLALVGGKAVHARAFGSGGFAMAVEILDVVSVADAGGAASVRLRAAPNPFRGSVVVSTSGSGVAPSRGMGVFGPDGRLLRQLDAGVEVVWDGRDDRGARMPAGVYFVGGVDGPGPEAIRVVRLP
jgi:hypothetical protein